MSLMCNYKVLVVTCISIFAVKWALLGDLSSMYNTLKFIYININRLMVRIMHHMHALSVQCDWIACFVFIHDGIKSQNPGSTIMSLLSGKSGELMQSTCISDTCMMYCTNTIWFFFIDFILQIEVKLVFSSKQKCLLCREHHRNHWMKIERIHYAAWICSTLYQWRTQLEDIAVHTFLINNELGVGFLWKTQKFHNSLKPQKGYSQKSLLHNLFPQFAICSRPCVLSSPPK